MISVLDFKNLELYKNNIYYPVGKETKNMETAIFLTSQNVSESAVMMNDKFVRNKMFYPGYFYANRYNFKIFNKVVRLNMLKDVTKMFVNMKGDKINYKNIRKYCYDQSQLTGINSYIDMSVFYENFFKMASQRDIPALRMVNEYVKFMKDYLATFDTETNAVYPNKILLLNLDALNIDIKDSANYERTNTPNIFAMIFYLVRYQLEAFKTIGMKILIRSNRYTIMIDPVLCDKDSYKLLRTNLMKLKQDTEKEEMANSINNTPTENGSVSVSSNKNSLADKSQVTDLQSGDISSDATEAVSDNDVRLDAMAKAVTADIIGGFKKTPSQDKLAYAFVGDQNMSPAEAEIDNKLESNVEKTVKQLSKENKITKDTPVEKATEEIKDALQNNEEFMSTLSLGRTNKLTNLMSASNLARNKLLAEKQANVNFQGKTIDEILNEDVDQEIKTKEIKSDILNKTVKNLKLPNFDKSYNDNIYDKDIIDVINSFKNKSVPVYILSIDKQDTSDTFNKKFTWTVSMEAADRSRHKLVFDTPKFINDSFMYLNGNQKNMYKQLFLLPISKTEPTVVQVCTNYNKAFVRRLGEKLSPKTERFRKIMTKHPKIKIDFGDNTNSNTVAITNLEFDELAKAYKSISVKGVNFIFNLPTAIRMADELEPKRKITDNIIPVGNMTIGKNKPEVIYLNTDTNIVVGSKLSLVDYIVEALSKVDPDLQKDFTSETVGKKYVYNSVTIMGKAIPLILLLSYVEGISTILKKAGINHEFSDTRPQLKDDDKNNKGIIEFSDGYLIYDKYPYSNSLLLNGLTIPTKNYAYSDLDEKETYLDIFNTLYGAKKLANALDNFYDLLLDPKTVGVLKDLSMPSDFVGVFLYANKLLEDNEYIIQTSANTNRIRSNEIVPALVYKTLATAYEGYRSSAGNKNPQKMTIPKDQVLKNVLMLNTVEDYSTLGPVLEAEKVRAVSFKGHSGMNLDRAYTLENRSYDKSMLGIISMSSPPTGSVGVVRQLPLDSNILSAKGYLKSADSDSDITQANMCSPAEEMIPMCTTKDDAPRMRNCPL